MLLRLSPFTESVLAASWCKHCDMATGSHVWARSAHFQRGGWSPSLQPRPTTPSLVPDTHAQAPASSCCPPNATRHPQGTARHLPRTARARPPTCVLGVCGKSVLPQCVSMMPGHTSFHTAQAPSSCAVSQMWSRPPRRAKYGMVLLSQRAASRCMLTAPYVRGPEVVAGIKAEGKEQKKRIGVPTLLHVDGTVHERA